MGKDKATLIVAGVTLFEKMLQAMQELFDCILIAGDRADLIRPGIPCFPDRYPGSALGGLYTGLSNSETPYIFAAPCDMPYPDTRLMRKIIIMREGYDAVVPKTPAGLEPLFAVYGKACLEPIRRMLINKRYKISSLFSRIRVRYLDMEELRFAWERSLWNINTPEDYDSVQENKP